MTSTKNQFSKELIPRNQYYFYLLSLVILGFASGIPFLLTLSTLAIHLTESGHSKTTIGFLMFATLPYSLKFLWAPFLDRIQLPFLTKKFGQRRGWALLAQSCLIISIVVIGFINPYHHIYAYGIFCFLICFFAATQDSIIDAYRIELIPNQQMGPAATASSIGFRLGMLASGAGSLYIANTYGWTISYMMMGALILISVLILFLLPEPKINSKTKEETFVKLTLSNFFHNMFAVPIKAFQFKDRLLLLLLFIFFFKTADSILNFLTAPLFYDLGFSKIDFANITKIYGVFLMILGGVFGSFYIARFKIYSCLILSLVLQIISCILFSVLAHLGHDITFLTISIGFESFVSGMTATAFITYLSGFCTPPFTATHFTLLYSFGSLGRTLVSFASGIMADNLEWATLFLVCSLLCCPSLIAILLLKKRDR